MQLKKKKIAIRLYLLMSSIKKFVFGELGSTTISCTWLTVELIATFVAERLQKKVRHKKKKKK